MPGDRAPHRGEELHLARGGVQAGWRRTGQNQWQKVGLIFSLGTLWWTSFRGFYVHQPLSRRFLTRIHGPVANFLLAIW